MLDGLSAIRAEINSIQAVFSAMQGPSPVAGTTSESASSAAGASFSALLDQLSREQAQPAAAAARLDGVAGNALAGATVSSFTPESWAADLLRRLGAPLSASNLAAVVAWERAEGGNWNNSARFNPLNTTQPAPGSTTMNSVGVRSYTDYETGMAATVQTLTNGRYGGILAALRAGTNAQAVRQAVINSPWGTSAGAFSPQLLASTP